MKKKLIIAIIGISTLVLGTTYAWFTWDISLDIEGTTECFEVNYVKGKDIGSNENKKTLMLGKNYFDGLSTTVQVNLKDTCDITSGTGTLYLNTETSTSEELLKSNALKYNVMQGNEPVATGTINSTGKNIIYGDFDITTTISSITIYVWIDSALITENNYEKILSSTYYGNISLDVESR